jgi:hypothetical protein
MAQYSTVVKLAKQGDPRAIAYLISRTLHQYGIKARANLKGHCLRLLLEAEQVPHQSTMVKLVSRGMQKLNVKAIQTVKLYGRSLDTKTPAWRQVIKLAPTSSGSVLPDSVSFNVSKTDFDQSDFDQSDFKTDFPKTNFGQTDFDQPDFSRSDFGQSDFGQSDFDQSDFKTDFPKTNFGQTDFDQPDFSRSDFGQSDFGQSDFDQTDFDSSEVPIFQLSDLDPDAVILLPMEPKVHLKDLDPEALILFPVEPATDADIQPEVEPDIGPLATPQPAATPLSSSPSAPTLARALPKRLTLLLLSLLWLRLGIHTLTLLYSLLSAGSFSLYTGLDLSNTNQPFASLLAGVVSIADFLFAPLDRIGLWINLITIVLFLVWLHRLHAGLRSLFGTYPISPAGAVARFVLPIYNLWGIGNTCFTLAKRLTYLVNPNRFSQRIRRLTIWLYGLLLLNAGLQGLYFWLLNTGSTAILSLWYYVARDAAVWLLSLIWLRLVRTVWRAVRRVYQALIPPVPTVSPPPVQSKQVNIRAILLGAGTALLSLILFNSLLGMLAAGVFVSSGLQPESMIPTFYDSESLLTLALLGSFFCIGLGGFLTAQLATAGLLHALGLGILLTLIGLALQHSTLLPMLTELPFWFKTASTALIIPAALMGGGLRQWFNTL